MYQKKLPPGCCWSHNAPAQALTINIKAWLVYLWFCRCAMAPTTFWWQLYCFLGHPVVQMYACMMPTNPIDLRTHFCILYFSMWILILKTIVVSIAIMSNCIAQGTLIAKNTPLHRIIAMHCGYRSNKCFRRRWEGQVDSSNTTSCHPFDTLVTGMHRTTPIF